MYVYASKSIDRPIDEVWEFVTEIERMDEWSPVEGPIDNRVETSGDLTGVGSRLTRRYSDPNGEEIGDSIVEVTEFDPPRRLALTSIDPGVKTTFTIQLDSIASGTLVSMRNGDPSGSAFDRLFRGRSHRRILVRMLDRLKQQIEAEDDE